MLSSPHDDQLQELRAVGVGLLCHRAKDPLDHLQRAGHLHVVPDDLAGGVAEESLTGAVERLDDAPPAHGQPSLGPVVHPRPHPLGAVRWDPAALIVR